MRLGPKDVAVGIDVGGARKGCHLVALNGARQLVGEGLNLRSPQAIAAAIAEWAPRVVGIDSPSGWAKSGKSRLAERALRQAGIQSFYTPTRARAARGGAFYAWVFNGEQVHAAARQTHPAYLGRGTVWGRSIEVFPNATVRILTGQRPPVGSSKAEWRRRVLTAQGILSEKFTNLDFMDAALCALTGLYALDGDFQAFGDPAEGLLIAPAIG